MRYIKNNLIFGWLVFFMLSAVSYSLPAVAEASTIKAPPSNLGLVGYWPMNEGVGTIAGDASGNGRSGTLTNSPTWTTGKRGNAVSFSGASSNYVSIANSSSWDFGTGNFTISLWVKPTSFTGYNGLVSGSVFSGSCQNGWSLYTQTDGVVKLSTNCANSNLVTSVSAMTLNQWNHIVVVRSGTGATDLNIYINSVAGGSPASGNVTISSAGSGIVFGRYYAATLSDHYFDGQLDDVRIYNRALSAGEITTLYGAKEAVIGKSQSVGSLATGLVGHWTFDGSKTVWTDTTTGTTTDSSTSGNSGTLTNMNQVTTSTRGVIGQAITTNGSSSYVALGRPTAFTSLASVPFSMSLWFKVNSMTVSSRPCIFGWGYDNTRVGFDFGFNNWGSGPAEGTGKLGFVTYLNGGFPSGAYSTTDYNLSANQNKWVHAVVTWNGTAYKMYIDGVDQTNAYGTQTQGILSSTSNIAIGAKFHPTIQSYFNGSVDDVRVYSRVLTTAEITRLYNLGRPTVVKLTGLLDRVGTATAAYSVRKLRAAYTGSAIRVRRSSDNAEQDIGFASDWLNTVALESFVGAGNDGFIVTWYNQASSGTDATQSTTTLQPQIVSSGSTITQNGKPAVYFAGTSRISATSVTIGSGTIFTVARSSAAGGQLIWEHGANAGSYNGQWLYTHNDAAAIRWFRLGIAGSGKIFSANWGNNASMRLLTVDYDGTQAGMKLFINTAEQSLTNTGSGNPGTGDTSTTFNIGARANNDFKLTGYIQEIVVYGSQLSTVNRSAAELNINRAYTLY